MVTRQRGVGYYSNTENRWLEEGEFEAKAAVVEQARRRQLLSQEIGFRLFDEWLYDHPYYGSPSNDPQQVYREQITKEWEAKAWNAYLEFTAWIEAMKIDWVYVNYYTNEPYETGHCFNQPMY